MIRLGLCCKFYKEPIRFRTSTATHLQKFNRQVQLDRLSELCFENANALSKALEYCGRNKIGCFRVNSQLLPLKTHPVVGYDLNELPDALEIMRSFSFCRRKAQEYGIRLTFHPDQFVVLSSPHKTVRDNSVKELDYQSQVSKIIGADVITIHGGGGYGNKGTALKRLGEALVSLPARIRSLLAIENDDRVYTPLDLLPFCHDFKVPFVYDVHHHRCLPDGLSIKEVTKRALKTWRREPLFHISSPKQGWGSTKNCFLHHDFINLKDFPLEWKHLNITVEVEAKSKEAAVKKLYRELKVR